MAGLLSRRMTGFALSPSPLPLPQRRCSGLALLQHLEQQHLCPPSLLPTTPPWVLHIGLRQPLHPAVLCPQPHRPTAMGGKGQGEVKPILTLIFCPSLFQKATDSGKKPEEEEEDQMAGRPGHWLPQTSVCDIVMGPRPWAQ